MVRAVLFDLDDTLLDRCSAVRSFISCQYDRLRLQHLDIDKNRYITRFLTLKQGGYVWKDKVYAQMLEEFPLQHLTAEELLHDYVTRFHRHAVLFPDAAKVLQDLNKRGIQLAIVTNGQETFQMTNIYKLDIQRYMQAVLVSGRVGIKKPNPRIFHLALAELGVQAKESLFVGDHPINDIQGARQAGIESVWKRTEGRMAPHANHVIDNLSDLLYLL